MKEVKLSNGGVTLVDDEDYELVSQWKWVRTKSGYAQRGTSKSVDGLRVYITYSVHRLVMDIPKGMWVDHINGDGLDNRKENLRRATPLQNLRNRRLSKRNKTGYTGVSRSGKKWRAIIYKNGKSTHVGQYETKELAMAAYNSAAIKIDPVFWRLNEEN